MNTPNLLSLIRVILALMLVLTLSLPGDTAWYLSLAIFVLASLTDYLDGQIARKKNLITDLGKFLDPLADKLLVLTALIMLSVRGLCPSYLTIAVLARELALDGLRMIASSKGQVIAAGKLGKLKTVSQMFYIFLLMILRIPAMDNLWTMLFTFWVLGITLVSGMDYFIRNRQIFTHK